jgi:hypothetical protein
MSKFEQPVVELRGPLCIGCYTIIEGDFFYVFDSPGGVYFCPSCFIEYKDTIQTDYIYVRENESWPLFIPEYLEENLYVKI